MEILPASDWSKTTDVGVKDSESSGFEKKIFKIGRYLNVRCQKMSFYCSDIFQIIEFLHMTSILFDSFVILSN